jgi:hypothetical protein
MHSNRCCYFELRVNNAAHADAREASCFTCHRATRAGGCGRWAAVYRGRRT